MTKHTYMFYVHKHNYLKYSLIRNEKAGNGLINTIDSMIEQEILKNRNDILNTEKKQRMYCESAHFKTVIDAMVIGKDYIEVIALVCEENLQTRGKKNYILSRLTTPEAVAEFTRLFNIEL